MTAIVEQFKTGMAHLEACRIVAGGTLSQNLESDACAELDTLWWQMTDKEQAEVELWCLYLPQAPADLGLVDVSTAIGSQICPRKQG